MNQLTRIYQKQFQEVLFPLGFKSYKNFFFRIINDVVQIIALKKNYYECTIEFAINPLCFWSEASFSTFVGYSISILREGQMKGWDWRFQKSALLDKMNGEARIIAFDNTDLNWIVEDMLRIIKTELIPIFTKATTCEAALSELECYEKHAYGKVLFLPISHSTYYFYIKTGDFEKAREYLRELLTGFNEQSGNVHQSKEESLKHQLQLLEENDIDYFRCMLEEKEAAARDYFESMKKRIRVQ